jgi:hypothetical protein
MVRIFHGEITGDPCRFAKPITSFDLDPDVEIGDLVARWDHHFIWDEACIKGKDLEKLRWTGDDICDDVVKFLGMGGGDMLVKLEEYMTSTPREKWDDCVKRFWAGVEGQPPDGVNGSDGTYRPDLEHSSGLRTLARGQEVFWKYISPILTSLLHFSLVGMSSSNSLMTGGFSAPKIIEVLLHTSYLTSPSSAITNRRLFETTQMVLDAMNDMTPSTGIGFRSVIRVRMLHSQVRLRLLRSPKYDTEGYGIPINQEDLLATLGSFCVACIWSMERMGIYLCQEDKEAYITAWRHIGYYMGIQPAHLKRFYANYNAAEKHLCCSIVHLLEPQLGEPSGMLPLQLLTGITNRPLYGHSLEYHAELSRLLIGDKLADVFQLPRGGWRTRLGLWSSLTLMRLELFFGGWYRVGWERERIRLMKEFVVWLVMWQVGKRQAFERTSFGFKKVVIDIPNGVNNDKVNGFVNHTDGTADVKEQNTDTPCNERVHVDKAYIKALKRRYYRVIVLEPALLVGGLLCTAGLTLWYWHR